MIMKKKLQLNKETMAVLNTSEMSRVVGQAAMECPAEEEAMFPHEADCSMFYKCNWGTPVLMQCPDGLHFNPQINVCDWSGNGCTSGCSDGCFTFATYWNCTNTICSKDCDSGLTCDITTSKVTCK